ncbi:MAG: GNAT family N-acetyltransferase [Ilumatobacteraceae bacterium]
MTVSDILVTVDHPTRADVLALLEAHLADMRATSPPESVHALDPAALAAPDITFWTARRDGRLLGCAALRRLAPDHGEVKSMRTSPAARRSGIGRVLLLTVIEEAVRRRYAHVSLETGSQDFFEPARRLYAAHGFVECGPFGSYVEDRNSVFMTRALGSEG